MESEILQIVKGDLFPLAKNIMVLLILESEKQNLLTAEEIAQQLNANYDSIRTYLSSMKKRGLIYSVDIGEKRKVWGYDYYKRYSRKEDQSGIEKHNDLSSSEIQ